MTSRKSLRKIWVRESLVVGNLITLQWIFTYPNPFGQLGVLMSEKFGHKWAGQAAQDGGFEHDGIGNYLNTERITFHLKHSEISMNIIILKFG